MVTDMLYDQTENNNFIDHDPDKREKNVCSSQRQYLISLGPHQPNLTSYPRNEHISKHKHRQFSSICNTEFPLLEYSIEKTRLIVSFVFYFQMALIENFLIILGLQKESGFGIK